MEKKVKNLMLTIIQNSYEELSELNFPGFPENLTEEQLDEIESTFVAIRNTLVNFEWHGEKMKYERYKNIKD